MIVKVCGLKYKENYQDVVNTKVAWVGINFYSPSQRYIKDAELPGKKEEIRIGVYVKSTIAEILDTKNLYDIDIAQLHGDEDVVFCRELQKYMPVMKVFRIDNQFDWDAVKAFSFCDYFLFDTKTITWGGSGKKFDWSILSNYKETTPFLLSGGIGPQDIENLLSINHAQFRGVDINSGFETAPGVKSIESIMTFLSGLQSENTASESVDI